MVLDQFDGGDIVCKLLDEELEQSIYADAYADVNNQVNLNSRRTVVKMSDVEQAQEDEE